MKAPASPFGQALKSLRKQQGLSQADMAYRLDSTQRHVSFLETGRAQPSRQMIQRIERELALPIARSQVLYELAGFVSPYKYRAEDSPDVLEALDLIENRLLANWPFPGFVLDKRWTILRVNQPGKLFLAGFLDAQNHPPNLFRIFLSQTFRDRVQNWPEVAPIIAARLYREAANDPELADLFDEAQESGLLDGLEHIQREEIPVFVPAVVSGPDGGCLRLTSLIGQLASVQDAVIEGMTVELMVPMDAETEDCMLGKTSHSLSQDAAE